MREILFRGKREDNGVWIFGSFHKKIERCFIIPLPIITSQSKVDPATVGQYTGLRDCRGNRIFEGDIVVYDNSPYNAYCEPIVGEIAWRNGSLCFKYKVWGSASYRSLCSDDFFAAKCEVIGNIHDNYELQGGRQCN